MATQVFERSSLIHQLYIISIIILAVAASSCSTLSNHSSNQTHPLSYSDYNIIKSRIASLPTSLSSALGNEIDRHTPDETANTTRTKSSEELIRVLSDVISHSDNPTLAPDDKFEKTYSSITGRSSDIKQLYSNYLAEYISDTNYHCRSPIFYDYFQQRYAEASTRKACLSPAPFLVNTRYEGPKYVWLDPERVSSIHIVFAGEGSQLASRFGHVLIRLIVCPENDSTPEVCDENILEHITIGFMAHIDEFSINTFKALNGSYMAYLFANQFIDSYTDYTISEFRELYSLPLRLTDIERKKMVRDLSEIHWRYQGDYKFFTNNCASMLQKALRVIWPTASETLALKEDFVRPDSFFEAIRSSALTTFDKTTSLEEAERDGYYFSSMENTYNLAADMVKSAMTAPFFNSLDEYLQFNPKSRWDTIQHDTAFINMLTYNPRLLEALIMIEEYSVINSERLMLIASAEYLEEKNLTENPERYTERLTPVQSQVLTDCLITNIKQRLHPIERLNGIPESEIILKNIDSTCDDDVTKNILRQAIYNLNDKDDQKWQDLLLISQYWTESISNVISLNELQ